MMAATVPLCDAGFAVVLGLSALLATLAARDGSGLSFCAAVDERGRKRQRRRQQRPPPVPPQSASGFLPCLCLAALGALAIGFAILHPDGFLVFAAGETGIAPG